MKPLTHSYKIKFLINHFVGRKQLSRIKHVFDRPIQLQILRGALSAVERALESADTVLGGDASAMLNYPVVDERIKPVSQKKY